MSEHEQLTKQLETSKAYLTLAQEMNWTDECRKARKNIAAIRRNLKEMKGAGK